MVDIFCSHTSHVNASNTLYDSYILRSCRLKFNVDVIHVIITNDTVIWTFLFSISELSLCVIVWTRRTSPPHHKQSSVLHAVSTGGKTQSSRTQCWEMETQVMWAPVTHFFLALTVSLTVTASLTPPCLMTTTWRTSLSTWMNLCLGWLL